MSIAVNIRGTIINFPSSGESPNWAPAVVQFAQEVASSLDLVVGAFDVVPQTQNIDAYNGATATIEPLNFDPTVVLAVAINIATKRTMSSPALEVSENRQINIIYNSENDADNKWEIQQVRVGDAKISFSISDIGLMSFTTTTLAGSGHLGTISFSARALLLA